MKVLATILAILLLTACSRTPSEPPLDPAYRAEIQAWQKEHTEGMRRDWGTLAGLFWLSPGENSFGSDPENTVVLPNPNIPAQAGIFDLEDGKVTVKISPGVNFTLKGKPVRKPATLTSDINDDPDILELGSLGMWVIDREGRYGIRVRDTAGPQVAAFPNLIYFPIEERFRVHGHLVRSDKPRKITVPAENMGTQTIEIPGYVEFTLLGKKLRLYPSFEGKRLFYIFKDLTSDSHRTYPAGRYLHSDVGPNDDVVLDFNRAYNPPCAFTPYATCPLTPEQNVLPVAIEAGEMYQHP
jgi:uncharacterized protein (DUF1684 family)